MATEHRPSDVPARPRPPPFCRHPPGGPGRPATARHGLLDLRGRRLVEHPPGLEHRSVPQAGDAVVIDVPNADPTVTFTSGVSGALRRA